MNFKYFEKLYLYSGIFSRLKRLDVNDKIIKTSRSAKDASANESISPRKSTQKNFDTPTKSTRASKRQHASDSGDDSEEIPKTRSRENQEKTKKVRSKRGSSPGGSSRIAKKNKDGRYCHLNFRRVIYSQPHGIIYRKIIWSIIYPSTFSFTPSLSGPSCFRNTD